MTYRTSGFCLYKFDCQMPILFRKNDKDAESHLFYKNDWKNSQGFAKDAKCNRFCLTLEGDACLLFE